MQILESSWLFPEPGVLRLGDSCFVAGGLMPNSGIITALVAAFGWVSLGNILLHRLLSSLFSGTQRRGTIGCYRHPSNFALSQYS